MVTIAKSTIYKVEQIRRNNKIQKMASARNSVALIEIMIFNRICLVMTRLTTTKIAVICANSNSSKHQVYVPD